MNLKHKIGLLIRPHQKLWDIAKKAERIIFRWNERQQDKSFGSLNPDIKFSVFRPEHTHGLLSIYFAGLTYFCRASHEGFIPIADGENYRTQYSIDSPVNGTRNAWEYYFEQPCTTHTLEEVYQSQNVRLGGWTLSPTLQTIRVTEEMIYDMMLKAHVKKYIYDIANEKIISDGINEMIGVFVRGTDYINLRPKYHQIPPTQEQASAKLDEFLSRYGERKIFLATEDENIYNFFINKYGDLIYTTDKNLIKNYSGRDYIGYEIDSANKYKFGLDYLVKMICLSECKCLIASLTAGSRFARLLNHGRYTKNIYLIWDTINFSK